MHLLYLSCLTQPRHVQRPTLLGPGSESPSARPPHRLAEIQSLSRGFLTFAPARLGRQDRTIRRQRGTPVKCPHRKSGRRLPRDNVRHPQVRRRLHDAARGPRRHTSPSAAAVAPVLLGGLCLGRWSACWGRRWRRRPRRGRSQRRIGQRGPRLIRDIGEAEDDPCEHDRRESDQEPREERNALLRDFRRGHGISPLARIEVAGWLDGFHDLCLSKRSADP